VLGHVRDELKTDISETSISIIMVNLCLLLAWILFNPEDGVSTFLPGHQYISARLDSTTSKKTVALTVTAVRT
jgi:hypothetical protein